MVAVGLAHFVNPEPFIRIVPPFLPVPALLVMVSGVFEILGGFGVLLPIARRFSAYGLIALYVAVFPANIYMAVANVQLNPDHPMPGWIGWVRLPFQFLFIWVAWRISRINAATSSR